MSLIAELRLAPDRLSFSGTIETVPTVKLDLEREYATQTEMPIVFVWAKGDEPILDTFERALATDETVSDVRLLSDESRKQLYRLRITGAAEVVTYPGWIKEAMRLEMRYAGGWWYSRMRFPDRSSLSTFCTFCDEHAVNFRLDRLYVTDAAEDEPRGGLTDAQQETLQLAFERGYFEIPRRVTITELAAEFDISDQAVSERLRRACNTVVERELSTEW